MGITGAGTLLAILCGIGTNKALAVLIGPSGLGVISQLQMFRALVMGLAAAGLSASLTRFIAERRGRGEETEARRLHRSALVFAIGTGLALAVASTLFRAPVAISLFGTDDLAYLTAFCGIGGAIGGSALVMQGALNGYRAIGSLAVSAVAVSALNLGLMFAFALAFGTVGAGAAVALLPAGSLLVYAVALRSRRHPSLGSPPASMQLLKAPLRFGSAALIADFLKNATLLATRRAVIGSFGLTGNGWYQSVLTLSDQYFNLLTTSVTTYVLPTLASYRSDRERVDELNRVARAMFMLLTPILVVMLLAKEWVIGLLYSTEFLPAVEILEWQLVGGFFRMAAWTLGAPLLIVAPPRFIVAQELLWDGLYLLGVVILPRYLGLPGIGAAFLIASLLHAIALGIYMRQRIGFRWSTANRRLLPSALVVVGAAVALGRLGPAVGVTGGALALTGWLAVNLTRGDRERMRELVNTYLESRRGR